MTVLTPSASQQKAKVPCIVCLQNVPMSEVTAGSLYADNRQAFACNKHINDRAQWITTWAVFDSHQHQLREIASLTLETQP